MSSDNPLWQFSLRLYAVDAVRGACLALQHEAQSDVNLLLFLAYRGSLGQQLSVDSIKQIDTEVCDFRENVIKPVRELRKTLKGKHYNVGDDSIYKGMLDIELSAEKLEQAYLATVEYAEGMIISTPLEATSGNLYSYAALLGTSKPDANIEILIRHSAA